MDQVPLPALLPALPIAVHAERGESWYSIKTPSQRFVRIGRKEYLVACALDGMKNAGQIAAAANEADPSVHLEPMDVMRITDWFGKAGVLAIGAPAAASSTAKHLSGNPLFIRQNLISGSTMERIGQRCLFLVSPWSLGIALVLWVIAVVATISQWDHIWECSRKLFVADSIVWWLAAWICLKLVHEIGHATFAVKYRCKIHGAGLSWMMLTPVPFVDISGMWMNTNRWHRCACCLGGLVFESTFSSLALIVFLTSRVETVQYFACMLFTMGAISSVVINASPFMKFDGYHVLSEWLAWPNLYADAQAAVRSFAWKCAVPWRKAKVPFQPLLVVYGMLCMTYRFGFWAAILLGAYAAFQALGVLVVGALICGFILFPIFKSLKHALLRRARAPGGSTSDAWWRPIVGHVPTMLWCGAVAAAFLTLVVWSPSPWSPTVPAFVDYSRPHALRNETDGFLVEVFVAPGDRVKKGELLAKLRNPVLERNQRLKEIEVVSLREQSVLLQAKQSLAESQSIKAKLDAAMEQWEHLQQKSAQLSILSPCDGTLVQCSLQDRIGQFLDPGQDLGLITENEQLEVVGFVQQSDIDRFRNSATERMSIRLPDGGTAWADLTEISPRASEFLESPQLAASYGGPLSVELSSSEHGNNQWKMPHPRFKIRATLRLTGSTFARPGQTVGLAVPGKSINLLQSLIRLGDPYWQYLSRKTTTKS